MPQKYGVQVPQKYGVQAKSLNRTRKGFFAFAALGLTCENDGFSMLSEKVELTSPTSTGMLSANRWGWLSSGGLRGLQNRWGVSQRRPWWVRLPSTPAIFGPGRL